MDSINYYEVTKTHIQHIQDFIEDIDEEFINQNYNAFEEELEHLADFSDLLRSSFATLYLESTNKTIPDKEIFVPGGLLEDVRHSLCAMDALWEEKFGECNHNGDTIKKIDELLGD